MTSGSLHASFNRSGLVRILSEATPNTVDPKYDFGERLGQWLDFTDALALFSALNSRTEMISAVNAKANATADSLHDQLIWLRQTLSASILNDGVFSTETARIRFPTPLPQATAESASDFSPYHRYYLAHQRDMSTAIGVLRAKTRKALTEKSPSHRQLAELDITFEKALVVRERNLLAMVPLLVAKRFQQRYQDHIKTLSEAAASDDPANWARPGSWLDAFCNDTKAVLFAELELRLKPVAGLISALGEESDQTQVSKQ